MTVNDYQAFLSLLSEEEKKIAPENLYYEGDFSLLSRGTRVSVVGSRSASSAGLKRAEIITNSLVERGITVVSGLASGIDTVAHNTALKGNTIAVLGTPLDKCSPVSNKPLLEEIKSNHLAISQFELGSKVYPSNFPVRNKTMALISDATIIIEATEKSGTQHQGWEAIRLGRLVIILENVITESNVSWAEEMVKYGAVVLNRDNHEVIFNGIKEFSLSNV
jgi:DNA processing protein